MPPMYWPTGIHAARVFDVEGQRRVGQPAEPEEVPARVDERVERVGLALGGAAADRAGRLEERRGWSRAGSGPVGSSVTSSGASTGSWSRGTGTTPCVGAVARSGSGSPRSAGARPASRAAGSSPSRRRPPRAPGTPSPRRSRRATAKPVEEPGVDLDALARPRTAAGLDERLGAGSTVRTTSSPWTVAKAKSRSSSAGTAMIAPVP